MGTFPSGLARWRAFSPTQRQAFVQAWCLLPLVWLGLRVWKLPRLHAWLAAGAKALPAPSVTQVADAHAMGDAVNAAARHTPFPATCLTRSLLLVWLLGRRGVSSALRIGVQLNNGRLAAHAWVECAGQPVNDRPDVADAYAPFDDLAQALEFAAL
jgi:hypothetical protein